MDNEQRIVKLLAEKDPETLLRRVLKFNDKVFFQIVENFQFLVYINKIRRNNPDIVEKLLKEEDKEIQRKNGVL